MRTRIFNVFGLICLQILLSSCTFLFPRAEDILHDRNIDQEYFGSLSTCEQILIYSQIGASFVDIDHNVVIFPEWLETELGSQHPGDVGDCIAKEGNRQISLLSRMPDKRREISLAIHALIYTADKRNLLEQSAVEEFAFEAACRSNIQNPFTLQLLLFTHKYGFPDYYNESNWQDRVVVEICGK